jgi:hypothetical protein
MGELSPDIVSGESGEGGDLPSKVIQELIDGQLPDGFLIPRVDVVQEVSQHPQSLLAALVVVDVSHCDRQLLGGDMIRQDIDRYFDTHLIESGLVHTLDYVPNSVVKLRTAVA